MGTIGRMLRSGGNSAQDESRPQSSRAEGLIEEFESSEKGWFWETTRDGTLSYISDSVARALGREPADLLDRPFTDLISTETADGSATSERTLGFYLSSHVAFQDLIVRAKTKNEIWWSISGRPVHDEIGRFFGFRGFASDLTKMRQSEVELDRLARQDSLTGLANREVLRRALDDALVGAVRRKHRCSVFLLDLDRFKAVNDTLGHPAGDTLLRLVVAAAARRSRRAGPGRPPRRRRVRGRPARRLRPRTNCRSSRRASSTACRGPTRSTARWCRSARRSASSPRIMTTARPTI